MKSRARGVAAIVLSIPLLFALAACSGEASVAAASSRPTASADTTPRPVPTTPSAEIAPLRGTAVEPGSLDHPALAAKIDDHVGARPQKGLERTDIVFEELVEGGLTRYIAVWHSDVPELIGPVRSIRPSDPDIITAFGGIVAYSGGQQRFVDMMMAAPVKNVVFDYDRTGIFYRDPFHAAPHNVVLKAAALVAQNPTIAPPAQQFAYAEDAAGSSAVRAGSATSTILDAISSVSRPSFSWDAASSTWLRSQAGKPDLDESGTQLRATNVVSMRVTIDSQYGEVPKTVSVGSGEVWVSTGGKSIQGTWSKKSAAAPIVLTGADGAPLELAPGNTWVELVPTSGSITLG